MGHHVGKKTHSKTGKSLTKQINFWLAMIMYSNILKEANSIESRIIKSKFNHL